MRKLTRRHFNSALAAVPLGLSTLPAFSNAINAATELVGPMVGHVGESTARIWLRPGVVGKFELIVTNRNNDRDIRTVSAVSREENDFCIVWNLSRLKPSTSYRYKILSGSKELVADDDCYFQTAPIAGEKTKVTLALGSCAPSKSLKLWADIEQEKVDGLVLLGDTPYIDSTKLDVARQKHREFLTVPELASLIRHTPTWGTWDDHDFAGNDTDGRVKEKFNNRKAFVEYRANPQDGDDDQGIYCKFQYGPVEVFLLDTRWFSQTEPSPVDSSKPTLLGEKQWTWLLNSLKSSKATFKIIACGMIWDDKENREKDDWGTYSYERQALFEFIGKHDISGVLLIGGDIHCSRLLKYKTEDVVGYPLHQLIVSPIHDRVIPSLNVPHSDLVMGSATPHVWLKLDIDATQSPATLNAEWVQMDGQEMWTLNVTEADLRKRDQ